MKLSKKTFRISTCDQTTNRYVISLNLFQPRFNNLRRHSNLAVPLLDSHDLCLASQHHFSPETVELDREVDLAARSVIDVSLEEHARCANVPGNARPLLQVNWPRRATRSSLILLALTVAIALFLELMRVYNLYCVA